MTQPSAPASCRFPISKFILVLAYFIGALSHANPLFPDLPSRTFPAIHVLPTVVPEYRNGNLYWIQ
jgi:hypothetical protein